MIYGDTLKGKAKQHWEKRLNLHVNVSCTRIHRDFYLPSECPDAFIANYLPPGPYLWKKYQGKSLMAIPPIEFPNFYSDNDTAAEREH